MTAQTPISKKPQLRSLTDRLDWLESFFQMFSRDLPKRLIDSIQSEGTQSPAIEVKGAVACDRKTIDPVVHPEGRLLIAVGREGVTGLS